MLKKKEKYEYRPCKRCGENHYIYNRIKWLCKDCDTETTKERRGDLQSLFTEIWQERPHVCVKCGKPLGDEPKAIFFSHIRSRGATKFWMLVAVAECSGLKKQSKRSFYG